MLGVQHYLTMLGATVLIPLILCPNMGANGSQTAEVISSIFFVSGINTLIQTSIGDRYVVVYMTYNVGYKGQTTLESHSLMFSLSVHPFPVSPLSKVVPFMLSPSHV